MRLRRTRFTAALQITLIGAACSEAHNPDLVACRSAGQSAFKVALHGNPSEAIIRWVQTCMEKKGYKRIYDAGRCEKLEASVEEPGWVH